MRACSDTGVKPLEPVTALHVTVQGLSRLSLSLPGQSHRSPTISPSSSPLLPAPHPRINSYMSVAPMLPKRLPSLQHGLWDPPPPSSANLSHTQPPRALFSFTSKPFFSSDSKRDWDISVGL